MFIIVSTFIFFAYLYQKKLTKKDREVREIEELLKSEELKSAYALLEGKDNERLRIANDLHDRMGGQLSTVKIYLDLLSETAPTEKQQALLEKLHHFTDTSIQEIRTIAHDLSNSMLDFQGFQKAIEQLCAVINESKKLQVSSHISLMDDVPLKVGREMYRVIQELMTNTLRHAAASKVNIDITVDKEEFTLIFEDNGRGFVFHDNTEGLGLKSVRLRIERNGGRLSIESTPNRGATFIVEIPLKDEQNESTHSR